MPLKLAAAAILAVVLSACSATSKGNTPKAAGGADPILVVTTISTLNSFVQEVGGNRVAVRNLVPVGASPENYQPTPADIAALHNAAVLVENGAGLETWLGRVLDNAKNAKIVRVVCADGLPRKGVNPHLWMDPLLAQRYVDKVRDALILVDPAHRAEYSMRAKQYKLRLSSLRASIQKQIDTIPTAQRNMIVFHNAWQYYNDRFGLRTVGVVELSPGQEPNPQYIGQLVRLAKDLQVRAVFAEPEYSPKLVQALAQSAGIKTVDNLYDDSIGTDRRVANYEQMLQYDTDTIVKALR